MREHDQRLIRSLQLFAEMQDEHFGDLMNAALFQSLPPRVVLLHEGDMPDFLHVIVEGAVELFATHRGRETAMEVIVPTTTFILAAAIRDEVYLKSARTLVDCRILMIPAGAVRAVFGRDAAFARAVVGELALRYRGMVRALKTQKLRSGAERLANWMLEADARTGGTGRFTLPFEKRLLASLLGMTPENLSRSFAALAAHGLASDGRGIVIRDPGALRDFACPDPLIDGISVGWPSDPRS